MKKPSIRILKSLIDQVHKMVLSNGNDESVAFLTANHFDTGEKIILLGSTAVSAKTTDYLRQGPYHLEVSPLYVNRVLNVAEEQTNTVIMVHSHPFEDEIPRYSTTDDYGEALTSETISRCLENNPPVGSLLFGQKYLTSRLWSGLSKEHKLSTVSVLNGARLSFHLSSKENPPGDDGLFDRQVRAFGKPFQQILENLDIGIVGLGGTGSAVAEQLARMGVRKLRLVDLDKIEPSNISRLYGSAPQDAGSMKYKVDVVKSHVRRINNNLEVIAMRESVMKKDVLNALANCDLIFSCLDRHGPRAVLNELAYQCFVPVIDVGVGLERKGHGVLAGGVRATIIGPELPCLVCQEIVRPEVIMAENLSPKEYQSRREEQYVAGLTQNAPSVITYTTLAASLGLLQAVELLSDSPPSSSTLFFDLATKDIMRINGHVKEDCVCQKRLGKGFRMPFSVAD